MNDVSELPVKKAPGGKAHEARTKDGITAYLGLCNNRIFNEAMEKLDNCTNWDAKTTFAFIKFSEKFESMKKHWSAGFRKLVKKHAEHEEVTEKSKLVEGGRVPVRDPKTGKVKTQPKMKSIGPGMNDYVWKDKDAWLRDFHALNSETFHVKALKLTGEEMLAAGLTPKELRCCIILQEDADPEVLQSFHDAMKNALKDQEVADEDDEDLERETTDDAGPSEPSDDSEPA